MVAIDRNGWSRSSECAQCQRQPDLLPVGYDQPVGAAAKETDNSQQSISANDGFQQTADEPSCPASGFPVDEIRSQAAGEFNVIGARPPARGDLRLEVSRNAA